MKTPLTKQVDGHHYTDQYLQPVEAAYLLNAPPCWCKLDKYLTRVKGDKLTNLEKAIHCIEIEEHFEENFDSKLANILGLEEDPWIALKGIQLSSIGYNNRVCNEFLEEVVNLCTKDGNYQEALKAMYKMDYKTAKGFVKKSIYSLDK